jgi:molecular chaperone GrpE
MSESKPDTPESESETGEPQTGEPRAGEPRAEDIGAPPAPAGEGDRIALLEAEISRLKDQLLRALAETENVRRRGQRERGDAVKYGAAALVKDLLAVSDNLRRAIDSVPGDAAVDDDRLKTLLDGVELTEKELLSVFERHHIVKLEPLGEKLDPHRHEAMYEVPDPSQPPGTVVQLIEPGYLLHDRLVRPARVGVAKGAPAEPEAPADPPA